MSNQLLLAVAPAIQGTNTATCAGPVFGRDVGDEGLDGDYLTWMVVNG